jgi:hypothetical protein
MGVTVVTAVISYVKCQIFGVFVNILIIRFIVWFTAGPSLTVP